MENNRPSWDEYFLTIVNEVANRATCPRLSVGTVIVRDNRILTTGYNGSPPGLPHCIDKGCYMIDNHCIRTIHAEVNAVIQAAIYGISLKDSTAYCNYLPCYNCAKVLISSKIKRIVYPKNSKYIPNNDEVINLFKSVNIKVEAK